MVDCRSCSRSSYKGDCAPRCLGIKRLAAMHLNHNMLISSKTLDITRTKNVWGNLLGNENKNLAGAELPPCTRPSHA